MNRNPCEYPDESRSAKAVVRRRVIIRLVLGLALLFHAQVAAAATTRTVTNLNDSGAGSLRQAIADSASGDTVTFSVTGTITLTSGALVVSKNISINGPGATSLAITGGTNFGVFNVSNGTHTGPTVAISGLLIENGGQAGGVGGGIYNDHSRTTVNNCEIDNNAVGITNYGYGTNVAAMTINNCTIAANTGHGIENNGGSGGDAELNLANCTIYGNGGSGIDGGGNGYVSVILNSCTIAYNSGRNITGDNYYLTAGNTIFAAGPPQTPNFGPGSTFHITSNGYNLFSDNPGFLFSGTGAGNQYGIDPQLDPNGPQYNGGFTRTIALTFYGTTPSPAIDHGSSFGLTTDQRGQPRTYDNPNLPNGNGSDGTDIGAYEAPADPIQGGFPFVVTTTADHNDGVCGGFDCTLREAIQAVNGSPPGTNQITFAQGVTGTITVQSPLVVGGPNQTNIVGPGARSLEISGGGAQRIFYAPGGTTYISGLTLRAGADITTQNHGEVRQGGAIYNSANLTLDQCALVNNGVIGAINLNNGGNGGAGQGGAIYNIGNLTLSRCTFSGNAASGNAGAAFSSSQVLGAGGTGGAGQGGAVFNDTNGTLVVNTCTLNGNTATGGAGGKGNSSAFLSSGGNANGAAIYNLGNMTVTSTTISGNTGSGGFGDSAGPRHGARGSGGGGLSSASGSTSTIANTIVAGNSGNTAPDAEGVFTSNSYNLIGIGDQSSGFTGTADQVGTTAAPIDSKLGPLQNNDQGGLGGTDTMALLAGSPAIDQGKYFPAAGFFGGDQRLRLRTYDQPSLPNGSGGDGTDIGAFELGQAVLPTSVISQKTHGGAGTFGINLPLTGTPGVECRSGGQTGDFQLVLTFTFPITITGSPQAQVTSGSGQIGTAGASNGGAVTIDQSGTVVTVPLTNITNAQRIVVTVFGVTQNSNYTEPTNVAIPMGVLLGDVNADGGASNLDVSLVKAKVAAGATVDSFNFRDDVNADGGFSNLDVSITKAQVAAGAQLP